MKIVFEMPASFAATASIRKGSNVALRVTPRKWQVGKVLKGGKVLRVEVEDGLYDVEAADVPDLLKELALSHLRDDELSDIWKKTYTKSTLKSLDNIQSVPLKKAAKKEAPKKETAKKGTTKKDTTKKEKARKSRFSKKEIDEMKYLLRDNYTDPLSAKSLPGELSDPEMYANSAYGRVLDLGRHGPAVVVGSSVMNGKPSWIVLPLKKNPKNAIRGFPIGGYFVDKTANDPQVSMKELIEHRETAHRSQNLTKARNEDVGERSAKVLKDINPSPGDRVYINWSKGIPTRAYIVSINRDDLTFAIKGSGSRLRHLPLSMIMKKAEY